jgi:hypothetical protein
LLIVITDGIWDRDTVEQSEQVIHDLRQGGVLTSLAWLDGSPRLSPDTNFHGAEIVSHIRKGSDLFQLARSIVEVGVYRNLIH